MWGRDGRTFACHLAFSWLTLTCAAWIPPPVRHVLPPPRATAAAAGALQPAGPTASAQVLRHARRLPPFVRSHAVLVGLARCSMRAAKNVEPEGQNAARIKLEPEEADDTVWRRLSDRPSELRLGVTLVCGQSFRWRATGDSEWTGVIANQMVSVSEDTESVYITAWRQVAPLAGGAAKLESGAEPMEGAVAMERVRPDDILFGAAIDYFGLATPLAPLYKLWGESDPLWAQLATRFPGLRVLRQDPVECLFCFICSSNNNIARIALMVDRLSQRYGHLLGTHGGYNFHSFPSIEALAAADEEDLRALGTGYRAKFILQSAATVLENGGKSWLEGLKEHATSHLDARDALITLHGVGPKVADCVCLFSLDKHAAIPVDTHVWQITLREMDASLAEAKSLTPTIYAQVGKLWRERYGDHAGWAHTILFAADLTKFKKLRDEALGEEAGESPAKKRSPSAKAAKKKRKNGHEEAGGCEGREGDHAADGRGVAVKEGQGAKKRKTSPSKKQARSSTPSNHNTIPATTDAGAAELYEALYGADGGAASPRFVATPGGKGSSPSAGGKGARALKAGREEDCQGALKPLALSKNFPRESDATSPYQLAGGERTQPKAAGEGRDQKGALPKIPRKKAAASED